MATKLVDPFDNPSVRSDGGGVGSRQAPAQIAANAGAGGGDLYDPFDDAAYMEKQQGVVPVVSDSRRSARGVKVSDTDQPLDFTDRMMAGAIEDPQARNEFYASKRFPNLPEAEANQRYGFINGDPAYVTNSGSLMRENAGTGNVTGAGDMAGWLGRNALPIVGGTVGGILGGPIGAGIGGASGKGYTKLAGLALGDQQSASENALDMAGEAALQGVGWKVGDKLGEVFFEQKIARDIAKFNRGDARALQQTAKERFGIDLTPAETAGLGSLINEQTRLGMGFDEAGDLVRAFLQKRAGQVEGAVGRFIGEPPAGATVGAQAKEVGVQALDDAKAARSTAARSSYRMVTRPDVLVPEKELDSLMADDYIRSVFDKASTDPTYGVLDHPMNSMSKIDAVKKIMDDEIMAAGPNQARNMGYARTKLVAFADKQYPVYAEAREFFKGASPAVKEVENSVTGTLSRLGDTGLAKAATKLFESTDVSARDVARVRRDFVSQGKGKEWDDVLNHWLRTKWEGPATRDVQAGANLKAGANFRKAVYGTKAQKKIMKEAMGPERFQLFEKLMDVLEATGRVPTSQSMTEPAQQAAKREAIEAAPVMARAGEGTLPGVGALRSWWVDAKLGKWRTKLAKAITSPDSIKELEKLNRLKDSPNSRAAFSIVTTALSKAGVMGAASLTAEEPEDSIPAIP